MNHLSAIQVRVLGCLLEKEHTTPEQYPLTLNGLRTACNQKTSRDPVCNYTEGEVGHTLRELESMGLVKEAWGARVPKYEHRAGAVLGLHSKSLAILATLMLRGPQTPGELKTNAHRLHEFDDLDDVHYVLDKLAAHEPPLLTVLPRQPGQKEARYAHLLSGEPVIPAAPAGRGPAREPSAIEQRLEALEEQVAELVERLQALEQG